MEAPERRQRARFFFTKDLPDDLTVVPIKTANGLDFAVREGEMSQAALDDLNAASDHLLGVGLAHLGNTGGLRTGQRKE